MRETCTHRGKNRELSYLLTHLPNGPGWIWLNTGVWKSAGVSHIGTGPRGLDPSSATFLSSLAKSQTRNEATRTNGHMGCRHYGRQRDRLHHNTTKGADQKSHTHTSVFMCRILISGTPWEGSRCTVGANKVHPENVFCQIQSHLNSQVMEKDGILCVLR